jgi:ectoine hydroxylase-related dioxygenase (phytanoyl-CoA dioxygenase family)
VRAFTTSRFSSAKPVATSVVSRFSQVRLQSTMPAASSTVKEETLNTHASYPLEMTEDERYLFDLNGYVVIRGVLTPDEVQEANAVIDNHAHEMVERSEGTGLRNAVKGTKLYGSGPGRKDLGGVLEWGDESKVFRSILAHPRLVPLFHGILGKGYRMDHLPMALAQDQGAEGFQLHGGTVDCGTGEYNPFLAYHCSNQGMIRSALLGCNVVLTDHNAGNGGFCVVSGSHKSNFKMPKGMMDGEAYEEFIVQPVTKAGDVILFSEGTVHGAKAWSADTQRRTCLYRFTPATNVYGRSYFGHEGGGWPTKMYEGLTTAQRAVLEPPYANRLDRPNIQEDGSVVVTSRDDRKMQHDRAVYGTKYF